MDALLIAHKTSNVLSSLCLLSLLLCGLDLLLPESLTLATLQHQRHKEYMVGARGPTKDDDRKFLQTENFSFSVDNPQTFSASLGDSLEIYASPLFNIIEEVYLLKDGKKKAFTRYATLTGYFMFSPSH